MAVKKIEKVKVITLQKFKDKHTGKVHKVDDIFTVTKERYDEIAKAGNFVKVHIDKTAN